MTAIPALPPQPDGDATAPLALRFEDLAQDGRVVPEALTVGLGEAIWRAQLAGHPATAACLAQGVVPILTRLAAEGTEEPFSVDHPLTARGSYQFAHTATATGEVERLVLNAWVELSGPRGRTYDPQPAGAGERVAAGRVFAEHVLTRPFAPPDARRVRALAVEGLPAVPPARCPARAPREVAELPAGARPLEPALALDPVPVVLGLRHTDSNQHVNSLVYPRLFEEAALRRLAALGHAGPRLGRAFEVAFRKPSFAGEVLRVALRAFALGERLGAVGVFVSADDAPAGELLPEARPRVFARVLLAP